MLIGDVTESELVLSITVRSCDNAPTPNQCNQRATAARAATVNVCAKRLSGYTAKHLMTLWDRQLRYSGESSTAQPG
jgi:hypothetical protein